MDVTRENFDSIYPALVQEINTCSFMAFDEEMTGINTSSESRNRRDDTPFSRYLRMITVASKYSIIQFGLCLFHYDDVSQSFIARPYNFYLFPDSGNDIILSASAISFLRNNNMDFGRWISKGLTFVNEESEAWWTNKLFPPESTESAAPVNNIVLTKESDVAFLARNVAGLQEMLASETSTEFVFEKCNSFLRRAVYQYLESHHADTIVASTNAESRVVAKKCNAAELLAAKEQQLVERKAKLQAALGFRLVFNAMVAAKKPIVGHNCLFDLLFLFRSLHGDLPQSLEDFRTLVATKFPAVFDTKFIYTGGVIGDTALGDLYHSMLQQESARLESLATQNNANDNEQSSRRTRTGLVRFAEGFDAYEHQQQLHDAGYDAYCTGYLFAQAQVTAPSALSDCKNKIFMMQSLFDINLSPEMPAGMLKYRGTLFGLFNFPEKTGADTILTMFTDAGYRLMDLELMWIDGTSTYIHLANNVFDESTEAREIKDVIIPTGWILREMTAEMIAACSRQLDSEPTIDPIATIKDEAHDI